MPHVLSWERIAKKEVKQKEKRDTALRMLSDGLPVETTSKYTGPTGQQVKDLCIKKEFPANPLGTCR